MGFLEQSFNCLVRLCSRRILVFWGFRQPCQGSDSHSGTTWATVGDAPLIRDTGGHFSINMIPAISARGELRFKPLRVQ